MTIDVRTDRLADLTVDALFLGYFADNGFASDLSSLDMATIDLINRHISEQEFKGKALKAMVLHSPSGVKAKHIVVIGLGNQADLTPVVLRQAAAKAARKGRKLKAKSLAVGLNQMHQSATIDLKTAIQMMTEGLLLGQYQFSRYKTVDKEKLVKQSIESAAFITPEKELLPTIKAGIARGEAIATAILNARDLINEPPSKIKPVSLVQVAQEIAQLSSNISLTSLNEKELQQEGYAALLAVASGSEEEPYLIHLQYRPATTSSSETKSNLISSKINKTIGKRPVIALVGKGVTFDSGGLGLKPWASMLSMKSDMAGAGTVLGIFQALAELEAVGEPIDIEVHGIIAATENMISGKAMRPDDIIETKQGKTIEIRHTDAEGRLILADAITYANQFKPDYIVDFATLTGAAIRALGRAYAVYMGNNDELLAAIATASDATGELAWPLPLPKEYKKYLESSVADLQNITTNADSPGAIFGGLFIQEFVEDRPWAHIDMAGPAWLEEDFNPVYPKGATGYGILLGLSLLEQLAAKKG